MQTLLSFYTVTKYRKANSLVYFLGPTSFFELSSYIENLINTSNQPAYSGELSGELSSS